MALKILHINSGQDGGAALCAIRLNKSLEKQGIESRMLFAEGDSLPEGVDGAIAEKDLILWKRNYFFKIMRYLKNRLPWGCDFWKNRYELRKAFKYLNPAPYVHQPCSCYTNIAHHPLVEWADIVHLHWVPEFVDYPTFFKEVRKPIVWTLHDKFPAVGLEHYCLGYSNLPKELVALDKKCVEIKRKGVSKANNLSIVAISYQMADICSKSEILKDCPCTVIHNGVDTSVFKPISIVDLSFNIPSSAIVFMFSSYWIWDENKGLNRVIEALERINCDNKFLIVVGVDRKWMC